MTGELEHFYRIGLALAIGFVVGAERGWSTREQVSGSRTAGIRTFTLIGLLAGVSAELSDTLSIAAPIVAFVGVVILAAAGYVLGIRQAKENQGSSDIGLTTEVAMLLTFALAAYAVLGDATLAASAAVVTVVLLRLKQELHQLLAAIDRYELNGAIRLLVISVVILPWLPDRGFGPGGTINPFELWWMVVLISALSFVGYIAIKLAGPRRGPILGGALGGLASSTAVTLSFSRIAQRNPQLTGPTAVGIGLACAIMFVRILIIAALVNRTLALQLAPALVSMAVAVLLATAVAARNAPPPDKPLMIEIGDPADIPAALKFGIFLLAISLLSHWLQSAFGASGLYALALAAGLADVDAITLNIARMPGEGSAFDVGTWAIVLAALSNTAIKAGLSVFIGGRGLALRVVPILGAGAVVGLVVLFFF